MFFKKLIPTILKIIVIQSFLIQQDLYAVQSCDSPDSNTLDNDNKISKKFMEFKENEVFISDDKNPEYNKFKDAKLFLNKLIQDSFTFSSNDFVYTNTRKQIKYNTNSFIHAKIIQEIINDNFLTSNASVLERFQSHRKDLFNSLTKIDNELNSLKSKYDELFNLKKVEGINFKKESELSNLKPLVDKKFEFSKYINDSNFKDKKLLTESDIKKFDVSYIIDNFSKNIKLLNHQTEYYPIIQEIAKLNRSELSEFKKRILLSIENSESEEMILPYRIYLPATDCGFIFIPLHSKNTQYWKTALYNFTMAHKYDTKATRCIGVIVVRDQKDLENFEFYWQFVDEEWIYDEAIEKALTVNYPFRKTKMKKVDNRYKNDGYQ